jgi:hypothetical protein
MRLDIGKAIQAVGVLLRREGKRAFADLEIQEFGGAIT